MPDAYRPHAISEQTYFRWKKKYGGMEVGEAMRLKALEEENSRLKRLVAEDQARGVGTDGIRNGLAGKRIQGLRRGIFGKMLQLTVLRRYVMRLLKNEKVNRFLSTRHPEIQVEMSAIGASETVC